MTSVKNSATPKRQARVPDTLACAFGLICRGCYPRLNQARRPASAVRAANKGQRTASQASLSRPRSEPRTADKGRKTKDEGRRRRPASAVRAANKGQRTKDRRRRQASLGRPRICTKDKGRRTKDKGQGAYHANLVSPGTGTAGVTSGPNSYLGGLRSSLELRIMSGVTTSPV